MGTQFTLAAFIFLLGCTTSQVKTSEVRAKQDSNFQEMQRVPAENRIEEASEVCKRLSAWYQQGSPDSKCEKIISSGYFAPEALTVCYGLASITNSARFSLSCLETIKNKSYNSQMASKCASFTGIWNDNPFAKSMDCLEKAKAEPF